MRCGRDGPGGENKGNKVSEGEGELEACGNRVRLGLTATSICV
jgi:hypothetical protein